jgi:hypothetical protein
MKKVTRIKELQRAISACRAQIKTLKDKEKKARHAWTTHHRRFEKAALRLAEARVQGTKKWQADRTIIRSWGPKTAQLTIARDAFRAQIQTAEDKLNVLVTNLAVLTAGENSQTRATDEIVKQVFSLNDATVIASKNRESYLTGHIFPHLLGPDGKMNSQITFTSSDGLRRVVAMVNSITLVQSDMASTAKTLISQFFDRFSTTAQMNATVKPLYELTRQLLLEKTHFKVGPDLYRFLGMDLDDKVFPELSEAQRLLRASIRSEKTNSYIRIYERASAKDKWAVVPQS